MTEMCQKEMMMNKVLIAATYVVYPLRLACHALAIMAMPETCWRLL